MSSDQPNLPNVITGKLSPANALTMSSREIAELTGSTHDNVLKTVRALMDRGVVSTNETPYVHPQNGQTYPEFLLPYRDTMVVVSGYSPELRARIVDRWMELEAAAKKTAKPVATASKEIWQANAANLKAFRGIVSDIVGAIQVLAADNRSQHREIWKAMRHRPSAVALQDDGYRELGWVYEQAGVANRAFARRSFLTATVRNSLNAFCMERGVLILTAPVGDRRVVHWPADVILRWLDERGGALITAHVDRYRRDNVIRLATDSAPEPRS